MIRTNDHPPPHVHVIGPDKQASFWLHCPNGSVELRESYNFSRKELQDIEGSLNSRLAMACDKWGEIHGPH
ncbi:DUF4160 domain-containing protein [Burkholderia stagnalis]|uniref:DUF4160 domain-containing protein n=1 Tax=Burkholderia stagnalis TaxID=1503054 RepID=UPI0038F7A1B0